MQAANSDSRSAVVAMGSLGYISTAGDDTITVQTQVDGEKDAIKDALELLSSIGTVTVTPQATKQGSGGNCAWLVTFATSSATKPLGKK